MKVSGFTFVKNAIKYGYPVVESITSILPVVDEMIVVLGDSEDDTNNLIATIGSDKIKIIHSVWDDRLREGGKVLAAETDKAIAATASNSDWLFYIQADEVVHEKYYGTITTAMNQYKDDAKVEGLLFNYHHFYGSYKYIGDGRRWYSKEIRIIRNNKKIKSYLDAQGFRWEDNRKLQVKLIDAYIYHYGWVRNPVTMNKKTEDFGKLWAGEAGNTVKTDTERKEVQFDYSKIDSVRLFKETHPAVMRELVAKENWNFDIDVKNKNFKNLKHRILYFIQEAFGWRPFEYSNYKKI
ncbi:glycosyltransferase family 2 protein [Ferruginibacter lapsinanis]|uniref:glycosyltransferase family 2 protein n=1 Tax=Ferruginibacter lapsinanis TaxID=563172 RepID=UPI001E35F160|nr:glycosyltransferase family 2 protein [Ferruginibacter lapsinanis]UEG48767.1 glycosyltransferase family 2 protein [Ferruginibacter lapsinanis]